MSKRKQVSKQKRGGSSNINTSSVLTLFNNIFNKYITKALKNIIKINKKHKYICTRNKGEERWYVVDKRRKTFNEIEDYIISNKVIVFDLDETITTTHSSGVIDQWTDINQIIDVNHLKNLKEKLESLKNEYIFYVCSRGNLDNCVEVLTQAKLLNYFKKSNGQFNILAANMQENVYRFVTNEYIDSIVPQTRQMRSSWQEGEKYRAIQRERERERERRRREGEERRGKRREIEERRRREGEERRRREEEGGGREDG